MPRGARGTRPVSERRASGGLRYHAAMRKASPLDVLGSMLHELADWASRDERRRGRRKWIVIGLILLAILLLRLC